LRRSRSRLSRVVLTTGVTTDWWSIAESTVYTASSGGGGTPPPPTGGSLGPNVYVFTPSESQSSIPSQLNSISSAQTGNQFGTARYALLFEPGTYGSTSDPLTFTVGFYTSVAGLGQNPSQVVINGTVDVTTSAQAAHVTRPTTSGARYRTSPSTSLARQAAKPVTTSGQSRRPRRCDESRSTATCP
jgi:hypothetical protein